MSIDRGKQQAAQATIVKERGGQETTSGVVTNLYRYPIKGMTGEPLTAVRLSTTQGLPGDRAVAIARDPAVFDSNNPKAVAKQNFLVLARDPSLAKLRVRYDDDSMCVTIERDGAVCLQVSLAEAAGRLLLEAFLKRFLGSPLHLQPHVVQAPGHKFTDVSVHSPVMMRAISLINVQSVVACERVVGRLIDLRRFRANIYFTGFNAWDELGWVGRTIVMGSVRLKLLRRTQRCAATEVNPETGERDINVPAELKRHFGHVDMGVYAQVLSDGVVQVGDHFDLTVDDHGIDNECLRPAHDQQ